MKPINAQTLPLFAGCSGDVCSWPIRGIVVDFHGLGFQDMPQEPSAFARRCAEKGLLYLLPYDNPWSWMNATAVGMVDEMVEAAREKYALPDDIPVVACGGSMGGLSCLIYTLRAKRTPAACAANCPVCDLPYHYTERPDLPRTIYSAFAHYPGDFMEAVKTASPLHQAENMPDIPYLIVHGDADTAVNKQQHSDRFVERLKKTHYVTYVEVPGMRHCDLQGDAAEQYYGFITSDRWFG